MRELFTPVLAHLPRRRRVGDGWLLAAAAGLLGFQQAAARILAVEGSSASVRRAVFLLSTLLVVALALHFRRFVGAWLVVLGIVLNLIPIMAHGGLMPVDYATVERSGLVPGISEDLIGHQVPGSKDLVLRGDDIRFSALSDRYLVTIPWYGANIYSLGDFVIAGGVALASVEALAAVALAASAEKRVARQL